MTLRYSRRYSQEELAEMPIEKFARIYYRVPWWRRPAREMCVVAKTLLFGFRYSGKVGHL